MIMMCVANSDASGEEISSSSATKTLGQFIDDPHCSQESCQELRERVESLEEAVRAIVSALSDEKNRHFTKVSKKIGKNRAVRSVLSPSSSFDDNSLEEEENLPASETPPASSQQKSRTGQSSYTYIFLSLFDFGLFKY